jgi:hypothetical protein
MEAENWLKEHFGATTLLERQERLRSFINLELHIIKLREMGSHLSPFNLVILTRIRFYHSL